jgi:DnaJ-class molecular chaperone
VNPKESPSVDKDELPGGKRQTVCDKCGGSGEKNGLTCGKCGGSGRIYA